MASTIRYLGLVFFIFVAFTGIACRSLPDIDATVKTEVNTINTPLVTFTPVRSSIPNSLIGTVMRVVDGDTVDIVFRDGETERVRLLGIDTPETFTANDPNEYSNITDMDCLDKWGIFATKFAVQELHRETVTIVVDPLAGERGFFGRLLAYIQIDGEDFNSKLVRNGYARVYIEGTSSRKNEYVSLQNEAMFMRTGLWGCISSSHAPFTTVSPASSTTSSTNCNSSYPTVCIPSPPPDLDCGDIPYKNFKVLPRDPHRFDGDYDGVGCEN